MKLLGRLVIICSAILFAELVIVLLAAGSHRPGIAMTAWVLQSLLVYCPVIAGGLQLARLAKGSGGLATGDLSTHADTSCMMYDMRIVGTTRRGLENAVNERMKSEYSKTEQIADVSHDIKTH